MLPFTKIDKSGKSTEYKDFEALFNADRLSTMGRHAYTYYFLSKHHPKIAEDFNILKGLSIDARYINYQMGSKNANNARILLQAIRSYCLK
jgi:hypothetical protein